MLFRELELCEAEKIKQIDAFHCIKNAWRQVGGEIRLVEINWVERGLPNGLAWHTDRFKASILSGGKVYGCFDEGALVGYAAVNAEIYAAKSKYVLLEQLFVSRPYRRRGIGRRLFERCAERAAATGADKLYICAASAEDTIAFYESLGCQPTAEICKKWQDEDLRDIQLEYELRCAGGPYERDIRA